MATAARLGDITNHGGTVTGPGVATVLIGGVPAAVAMDMHTCAMPPPVHAPTVSPFPMGSTTVTIGGKPALRAGDSCICGASVLIGAPDVMIG
jgi:uncharacterized Zn-binding protein involved in type VI secretion